MNRKPVAAYIHGTAESERQRLDDLNGLTNRSFIDYLALSGTEVMCDFGCGPATLEVEILDRYPGARLVGIEGSAAYAGAARERLADRPSASIVNADVLANGLPDETFDLTFCRYVLEHVADPQAMVREMLRVTKPGGRIVAQENDLANVVYDPEFPGHAAVMRAFCDLQISDGGDPFVGRKLFVLFDQPGVDRVEVAMSPEIHTARQPERYRAWMSNSIRILTGAAEQMVAKGFISRAEVDAVVQHMRRRVEEPRGVALFRWDRVTAYKASEPGASK